MSLIVSGSRSLSQGYFFLRRGGGQVGTLNKLVQALGERGMSLSDEASRVFAEKLGDIGSTSVAGVRVLVKSGHELGMESRATQEQICERIVQKGDTPCTLETVIRYRLQYLDQSCGEVLRAAMNSLSGASGESVDGVFVLDTPKRLHFLRRPGDFLWSPTTLWFFLVESLI